MMSPKLGRLYTMKSPITMIVEDKDIVELRRFVLLSSYISLSVYILKCFVVLLVVLQKTTSRHLYIYVLPT